MLACTAGANGAAVHHYVFFGQDREGITNAAFLGAVPSGIAVQDGNYEDRNPKTGQQVTIPELIEFATGFLRVRYVFWCTQEPFYSKQVIPHFQAQP